MSAREQLERQWIPMAGGSCDVRMGVHALEEASAVFTGCVGKPRLCLVIIRSNEDSDAREMLRRQLVHAGFTPSWFELGDELATTFDVAANVAHALARARLTADDLCCVYGDADLISVASYVCDSWCGGIALIAIPTSEIAFIEGALEPRPLCVGAEAGMIHVRPAVRHVLLDIGLVGSSLESETACHLRSIMVATAMADSERAFSELWDRADAIMSGDEAAMKAQLLATARARGQLLSSTAAAVRQSAGYGRTFAHALCKLTNGSVPWSVSLAEGMRFAARVSVALGRLSIDDMLAQDELFEALDVPCATCEVEGSALATAIREEEFRTSNRFLLLVPFAIGQVRYTTLEEGVLEEHARAWCGAHSA